MQNSTVNTSIDQPDTKIDSLISSLLGNGPDAISAAKQLIFDVANQPVSDNLVEKTCELIDSVHVSPEEQEGLQLF